MTLLSCEHDGIVEIIQGEDAKFSLWVAEKSTGSFFTPKDISGANPVKVQLLNDDDTVLEKTLASGVTIGSAGGGRLDVTIPKTETALLKVGVELDIEAELTISGTVSIVQYPKKLTVKAQLL